MKLIDFHTHKNEETENVISIINQYPVDFKRIYERTSVGIHPWFIDLNTIDDAFKILENILHNDYCIAVGECGLDKNTDTPFRLQRAVFRKQLKLAEQYKKPVIIHCVSSFQQVIADKIALTSKSLPLIIHGFSKKNEMAQQLIDNGFYLSFGSNLLTSKTLQNSFMNCSHDKIFLETGSHAESIQEIYECAAKLLSMSVAELNQIILMNFNTIFESSKTKSIQL